MRRLVIVAAPALAAGLLIWAPPGEGTAGRRAQTIVATRTTDPGRK